VPGLGSASCGPCLGLYPALIHLLFHGEVDHMAREQNGRELVLVRSMPKVQ